MLIGVVRRTLRSPALRTSAILAAGGVGFALGNILLARILPADEFGAVALLLSLIQVGAALGVLGLPTLVNRERLAATAQLLRYSLASAAPAAVIAGLVALRAYHLPAVLVWVLGACVAFASLGRIAGAVLQSRQHFAHSLLLTQLHNWLLLASAPVAIVAESRTALTIATVIVSGYLASAVSGWRSAKRVASSSEGTLTPRLYWSEGLSAAGFALALNVFFQLDRLVIGRLLSLEDLATYSVIAAIVGSAFRMLQVGAGYALTPRLRAATDREEALNILRREAAIVLGIGAVAAIMLIFFTPWIIERLLSERYASSYALVGAVIGVGFVRIWQGLASSVVSAIGSPRELFRVTLVAWAAVAIAVAAAFAGSGYGLIGVVGGLGVGWLTVAVGATLLARGTLARLDQGRSVQQ